MKTYLLLTFFFGAFFPLHVFAQDNREDIIYMKDGRILKGLMLDQVNGVSYKIRIANDSIIIVPAAKIEKITKEKMSEKETKRISDWEGTKGYYKPKPKIGYKDKGGFFQWQVNLEFAGGGIRLVGGYKFNQFAIFGVGIGIKGIVRPANGYGISGASTPYRGTYFPLFLYYSGDIFKKNVTPFYVMEAGYSWATNIIYSGDGYYNPASALTSGGPMGSIGFGVRIYSARQFTFNLSANLDIQYASTSVSNYYTGTSASMTMLLPGIKIGLGLTK